MEPRSDEDQAENVPSVGERKEEGREDPGGRSKQEHVDERPLAKRGDLRGGPVRARWIEASGPHCFEAPKGQIRIGDHRGFDHGEHAESEDGEHRHGHQPTENGWREPW